MEVAASCAEQLGARLRWVADRRAAHDLDRPSILGSERARSDVHQTEREQHPRRLASGEEDEVLSRKLDHVRWPALGQPGREAREHSAHLFRGHREIALERAHVRSREIHRELLVGRLGIAGQIASSGHRKTEEPDP
jgi:hypothetical protein